ncbi:MAG: hypothetical protein Q9207_006530, partial [Kuettlingeria erythrocarpa]
MVKNRSGSMGGISIEQLLRDNDDVTVQDHVEFLMDELRIKEEECADGDDYYDEDEEDCTNIVGKGLHKPTFNNSFDENDRRYGNEAELKYRSSAAAIIVVVPPATARIPAPSTGGAPTSTGMPPMEAYSSNTMDTADTTGCDTAVFDLTTTDTEDKDIASPMT